MYCEGHIAWLRRTCFVLHPSDSIQRLAYEAMRQETVQNQRGCSKLSNTSRKEQIRIQNQTHPAERWDGQVTTGLKAMAWKSIWSISELSNWLDGAGEGERSRGKSHVTSGKGAIIKQEGVTECGNGLEFSAPLCCFLSASRSLTSWEVIASVRIRKTGYVLSQMFLF